jgi:hypothetical protein
MKKCSKCKTIKPKIDFPKDKSRKDGYAYRCSECKNIEVKIYTENNKDYVYQKRKGKYNAYYNKRYANLTEEEKQKGRDYKNKWEKENKEKVRKYHKNTLTNNPSLKIANNIRTRMYQVLKGINKSKSTIELLGCSIKEYIIYLERKFDKNMNWDNYGIYWEIDHIKELYKFNLLDPIQQKEAFHFSNTQPLSVIENQRKR